MKNLLNILVMVTLVAVPVFAQGEWTIIPNPDTQMHSLYSIAVTPNGTVHAGGGNGTYIRNAGSGFANQPLPAGNPYDIKCLFFVDDDIGYLGGENETISKTTDGGANWVEQREVFNGATIFDMYFWSPDSGIAGGDNTTILRTTDGQTWTEVYNNPAGGEIRSIKCIGPNEFLAGGWDENYQGILLRSEDNGLSWNVVDIGTTDYIKRIDGYNSNIYITTGGSPQMLKSSDRGNTFLAITVPATNGLTGNLCCN